MGRRHLDHGGRGPGIAAVTRATVVLAAAALAAVAFAACGTTDEGPGVGEIGGPCPPFGECSQGTCQDGICREAPGTEDAKSDAGDSDADSAVVGDVPDVPGEPDGGAGDAPSDTEETDAGSDAPDGGTDADAPGPGPEPAADADVPPGPGPEPDGGADAGPDPEPGPGPSPDPDPEDVPKIPCTEKCTDNVPSGVCQVWTCDTTVGKCIEVAANPGSPCDDDDPCTTGTVCILGTCQKGKKVVCNDGNPCTDDLCDPAIGCVGAPNTKVCDDGNTCTADTCKDGACVGKPGAGGCGCFDDLDCVPFDDGNPCNGFVECIDGQCLTPPGSAVVCDTTQDGPCVKTQCSKTTGQCEELVFDNIVCDDSNPCTEKDTCFNGVCEGTFGGECQCEVNSDCAVFEDGNLCNGTLHCTNKKCEIAPESEFSCDGLDFGACLAPMCNPVLGTCDPVPKNDGAACDDADPCTVDTTCAKGKCAGGGKSICDDGDPCSIDTCVKGGGCTYKPNPGACDDGDACTVGDFCAGGKCLGEAVDCEDDNPCTILNACDVTEGCLYANAEGPCDDGKACTSNDACQQGTCVGVTADCADENPCTNDACIEGEGCKHFPTDGAPCSDGDACTKDDACKLDQCVGVKKSCDDENVCTDQVCDSKVGCIYTNNVKSCNDLNPCTEKDACKTGFCIGTGITCDDGNDCTFDSCNPLAGCVGDPKPSGVCDDGDACTQNGQCQDGACLSETVFCDDGNICTDDACDPEVGCTTDPNGDPCNDGKPCTTTDKCGGGLCKGKTVVCDDGSECTEDTCIPTTGDCSFLATAACSCTADADCEDGNPCTLNDCSDFTKKCTSFGIEGACDDGNACTSGDLCNPQTFCQGTEIVCDDGDPCTKDSCLPDIGCVVAFGPGPCDDGSECTFDDTCSEGECVGKPVQCDDGNPCTNDACDADTGCTVTANNDPCDDGDKCTLNDLCVAGGCKGTASTAPECQFNLKGCVFNWKLFCGKSHVANVADGEDNVDAWTGCLPAANYSGSEYVYKFTSTCTGTATVTVVKSPEVQGQLDLAVMNGKTGNCGIDYCIGGAQMVGNTAKTFVPVKDGESYFLAVDGRNGAVGDFEIDVSCDCQVPVGGDCKTQAFLPCESPISGDTTAGVSSVNSWEACVGLDGYTQPEYGFTYTAACDGLKTFVLKKAPTAKGLIDLFLVDTAGEKTCGPDNCVKGALMQGDTAVTTYSMKAGQEVTLIADPFGGAGGAFTLEAKCGCGAAEGNCTDQEDDDLDGKTDCEDTDCVFHPNCKAPPGECVANHEIVCHQKAAGDTTFGFTNVDTWDVCAIGTDYTAPEDVYVFEPPCTGDVTVRIDRGDGLAGQMALIVDKDNAGSCGAADGLCLTNALLGGDSAQTKFLGEAGQLYYLAVDGLNGATGAYDLSVDCSCVPKETSCFDGKDEDQDGKTDCDDVECEGVVPCVVGDLCEPTVSLECGGTASSSTTTGTASVDEWTGCLDGTDHGGKELVYSFVPSCDGAVVIDLDNAPGTFSFVDLIVLDGASGVCTNVGCIGAAFGTDTTSSFTFNGKAGSEYFLVLDSPVGSEAGFTLSADCTCKPFETDCANEVDDDGDLLLDCEDADCSTSPFCSLTFATCGQTLECVDACGGAVTCVQSCFAKTTAETLDLYLALQQCVIAQCAEAPSDQLVECVETLCEAELTACTSDPGPAPLE